MNLAPPSASEWQIGQPARSASMPSAIFVKTVTGKTITIMVDHRKTTIWQLKHLVEEREGVLVDEQKLIYGGKQMPESYSLEDCGIVSESTIHLVLRLSGC